MRRPHVLITPARTLVAGALLATVLVPAALVAAPVAAAAAVAPGAANTGVPDGTPLTVVTGTLVLSQAGKTYSGLDVRGRVRVNAPNITLANSIVRGDATKTQGALIDVANVNTQHNGFVLKDSTLSATYRSEWQNGIVGHDFTVVRSEITGTVDGVDVIANGNVTVQASWLHDFFYVSKAQSALGRETHNDGVQVLSGSNITVTGNTIYGARNAALMVTQDYGPTSALKFTGNWSSGGGCTVNMSPHPRTTMAGTMTISGNAFKHTTSVPNCAIVQNRGVTIANSSNVWQDTGGAVALSRGA